ncbi:FAD-binding monooxygenase (plasmid) [Streptomyces finlayi]|uniref:FAD-binding monooxygenase n=1 Tax=Streptomyces finlayi TaxID=67296 RepID=A0A7G7BWE9_9ACTN|nr:FAD-dependent oxidoreductase [Streptomyces finlayi]QNE79664.1 FAD-binding monooxygenase [Streptomyces finlayi]
MRDHVGNRAVVLGGSVAGSLAARVLAEFYHDVVVVDRDTVLGVSTTRKGAPHTRHAHGLHARGHLILEELFPGFTEDMSRKGYPVGDLGEMRWYFNGRRLPYTKTGLLSVTPTRPILEHEIRTRVAALPNVTYLERHDILGLLATPDNGRVVGARVRPRDGADEEAVLDADLVVDATGRGSRTPVWLAEMGYERPAESRVRIGLAYTTRFYRRVPGSFEDTWSINPVASPDHPRGAFFGLSDEDRCIVSLTGILGDHPPTDPEGFLEFARSLSVPDVYEGIKDAEPLDDPTSFGFPASVRRHYERLRRFPDGLTVLGDAVCSFNPVYGQGMSVAAWEAMTLRRHLRGARFDARTHLRALGKVVDNPWEVSAGGDLAFPGVEGRRTAKVTIGNAYVGRVQHAASKDPEVAKGFMRVAGLIDPPTALMRPRMMARVLRASRGMTSPAGDVPATAPQPPDKRLPDAA